MSEKLNSLAKKIADTTKDYRLADGYQMTEQRVVTWIEQFPETYRVPLLHEMGHVLSKTYFSEDAVEKVFGNWAITPSLCGNDPKEFWRKAHLLDIQQGGSSQMEMTIRMKAILRKRFDLTTSDEPSSGTSDFVFLDDFLFTGGRLFQDLKKWIACEAPDKCNVHVILLALHSYGAGVSKKIMEFAKSCGKDLTLRYYTHNHAQDTLAGIYTSDVLRPQKLPDDKTVREYAMLMKQEQALQNQKFGRKFKLTLRPGSTVGTLKLFSDDAGRDLLEEHMLIAGCLIRQLSPYIPDVERPLGHQLFPSFGFGALFLTYRNCPNNCPLAWWAGQPWSSLFPRRTNRETAFQANRSISK